MSNNNNNNELTVNWDGLMECNGMDGSVRQNGTMQQSWIRFPIWLIYLNQLDAIRTNSFLFFLEHILYIPHHHVSLYEYICICIYIYFLLIAHSLIHSCIHSFIHIKVYTPSDAIWLIWFWFSRMNSVPHPMQFDWSDSDSVAWIQSHVLVCTKIRFNLIQSGPILIRFDSIHFNSISRRNVLKSDSIWFNLVWFWFDSIRFDSIQSVAGMY